MRSNLPHWLTTLYAKWGDKIAHEGMRDWRLANLAGITRHKARRVIELVETHGPPSAEDADLDEIGPEDLAPVEEEEEEAHWFHHANYVYDEERDLYITFIRAAKKPLVVPGSKHRAMLAAYSNWDGMPATLNEVGRDFGIPRAWLVEYLRVHQMTHDREPFSAEEVAKRGPDEMVEDALQARRAVLYQKYEAAKWQEIKKQASKWVEFEETVLSHLLDRIESVSAGYQAPRLQLPPFGSQDYALVVGLTDFHWGAYAWGGETGDRYDRKLAERRLQETTEAILSRIPGQPEKIILPVGSDFFHCDGDKPATTSGTLLDVDGTPTEILVTGCELTQRYVDLLRQIAPVEIVLMSGNHDRSNGLAVLLYLQAWFRDTPDVTVVRDYQPRVYCEYGNTLIAFSHGDGAKIKDLGPIMATEAREAWGRTHYHVAFGGHLHHQHVQEINGITHYLMPSLSGTDRWHSRQGYTTSNAGLCAYVVDKEQGVTSTIFVPVQKES